MAPRQASPFGNPPSPLFRTCRIHQPCSPLFLPVHLSAPTYLQVLKSTSVSLWVRNMELSCFGVLLGAGCVWFKDGEAVSKNGFFYG